MGLEGRRWVLIPAFSAGCVALGSHVTSQFHFLNCDVGLTSGLISSHETKENYMTHICIRSQWCNFV